MSCSAGSASNSVRALSSFVFTPFTVILLCTVVIIAFSTLAIDFIQRYLRDRPTRADSSTRGVLTPRLKIMLAALGFSTTTLFIRCVQPCTRILSIFIQSSQSQLSISHNRARGRVEWPHHPHRGVLRGARRRDGLTGDLHPQLRASRGVYAPAAAHEEGGG